jgi:putative sigma-54 modulation protein
VQISISTRHGKLSDATQEKLKAKLEKLPHYFERLTSIELTVDLEHNNKPDVELRVSAEHKHDFVAREAGAELFTVFDSVVAKVEQQIRKYKEKVQEHRGPGLRQESAKAGDGAADADA